MSEQTTTPTERDELAILISRTRHVRALHLELPASIISHVTAGIAEAVLEAGYRKPRITGYLVVDTVSRKLDWDGELHPTYEAAIESLTGPYQQWCKTVEEETEDRTYWGTAYTICPVCEGAPNV